MATPASILRARLNECGDGEDEWLAVLDIALWAADPIDRRELAAWTRALEATRAVFDQSHAASVPEHRECQRCGEEIPTAKRSDSRFCTPRCRKAAKHERARAARWAAIDPDPDRPCHRCAETIPTTRRPDADYCSRRCQRAASSERKRKREHERRSQQLAEHQTGSQTVHRERVAA